MPYVALAHAGRVHYAERGERRPGRPSAVLIHGAGASSAIWMMVLTRVARGGHAIAIDLPGHGPSAADGAALDGAAGLTLARYRDAVGELAGTLCLGPSVLVGHSLGALVAIEAALAWPDKVRAWSCARRRRACPSIPSCRACCATTRTRVIGVARRARAVARAPSPAIRRGFLAAGEATPADVTRADFDIVRAHRPRRPHRRARLPGHLARRRRRPHRAARPNGRTGEIVTLPDVGHLTPIEAPAAVAEAVTAAIGRWVNRYWQPIR